MSGRYDAVLFDFDGVLADTEPVHCAAWAEVLKPLGFDLNWDFYVRCGIGVTDRVMLETLLQIAGSSINVEELLEHWPAKQRCFERLVTVDPPVTEATAKFITGLKNYDLAVVTSSQVWEVEPALVAAGIRPCFAALVGAADVRRHKPEPDPYLAAAARLGARRPLVVEDSDAGVASGRAAGFAVVRVSGPHELPSVVGGALGLANGSR